MGGATALGLSRFCPGLNIHVTAKHLQTLEKFKAGGINASLDNEAAARHAEIVILAVKPWLVKDVLTPLVPCLKGKLLISIAAGIPASELGDCLSGASLSGLYTVIPNLAIEVGESMTFAHEIFGTTESRNCVQTLFSSVGKIQFVSEKQLNAGMMVASCGTALALRYMRAAMEGGIQLGLYPKQALEAVLQTVKGAAILSESHGAHPEADIDKVTTPGGITIRALNAMEEAGFSNAVIKGLTVLE